MVDLEKIKKIHMIGVGGIGMSGLARLFLHEKKGVSGSDISMNAITQALEKEGVELFSDQGVQNITDDIDLVVYTEAMPKDHPEVVAAREKSISTMNYFEALGSVANKYYLIAVAGTHGKTTTTAMLTDIFEEASFDPTVIVGSLRTKTGSNFRAGKSKYFIVEACEYKRDFLTLEPDILIITNLEHEHVDYYKRLEDVQSAFKELAQKVPNDGFVIANMSDVNVVPILKGLKAEVKDYQKSFDPMLSLPIPGMFNQMNAAAARAAAETLGIEKKHIVEALENFAGTKRRFEYKGDIHNAPVYDDYGHHPTEIAATIRAAKEKYPNKKLTVVFQPHTYSRTKELYKEFVDALCGADRVIMIPIYTAREIDDLGVSSEGIIADLEKKEERALFFHTHAAAAEEVRNSVNSDDVVVIMGAGDVTNIAERLVSKSI